MSAATFSMRGLLRSLPGTAHTMRRPAHPLARAAAGAALRSPLLPPPPPPPPSAASAPHVLARRSLTTTPPLRARQAKKKPTKGGGKPAPKKLDPAAARALARKRKQQAAQKLDPKVAGLMKVLYASSQVAAPLRMARQRHLRHWVVHRAWMLHRRARDGEREREMMRMQQSMASACEVLRNLEGPGSRPAGWLYRMAMRKEGVWRENAVPIEYARPLVETPGPRPWNHEWKRM